MAARSFLRWGVLARRLASQHKPPTPASRRVRKRGAAARRRPAKPRRPRPWQGPRGPGFVCVCVRWGRQVQGVLSPLSITRGRPRLVPDPGVAKWMTSTTHPRGSRGKRLEASLPPLTRALFLEEPATPCRATCRSHRCLPTTMSRTAFWRKRSFLARSRTRTCRDTVELMLRSPRASLRIRSWEVVPERMDGVVKRDVKRSKPAFAGPCPFTPNQTQPMACRCALPAHIFPKPMLDDPADRPRKRILISNSRPSAPFLSVKFRSPGGGAPGERCADLGDALTPCVCPFGVWREAADAEGPEPGVAGSARDRPSHRRTPSP